MCFGSSAIAYFFFEQAPSAAVAAPSARRSTAAAAAAASDMPPKSKAATKRTPNKQLKEKVASWGLPARWLPIVLACLAASSDKDLSGVELFAGEKLIAAGLASQGLSCKTIELEDGQDITTESGQKLAISYLCRCQQNSLIWFGTVCSSWVFVGRSNGGRHTWWPSGDTARPYTKAHNMLADITVDLAWLAFCLGLHVVIEQPLTSCLFDYPPMLKVVAKMAMERISVHLDGFGSTSMKPLQLYGTVPWPSKLQHSSRWRHQFAQPMRTLTTYKTSALGSVCVTGKKKALKESSAYPKQFGRVIGELHGELLRPPRRKRIFSLMDDV